jgi:hypothetical protein
MPHCPLRKYSSPAAAISPAKALFSSGTSRLNGAGLAFDGGKPGIDDFETAAMD